MSSDRARKAAKPEAGATVSANRVRKAARPEGVKAAKPEAGATVSANRVRKAARPEGAKATKAARPETGKTAIPEAVEDYLRLVEADTPRCCPEQHALAAYVRRVFRDEALIVEQERLGKYLSLERYFPFRLFPWERFLVALWLCVYKAPGVPRWKTLFCLVGRGAGKDGFIAFLSFCLLSPYNPVPGYDVDICANDEEQATRPVKDVLDVLETPRIEGKLKKHYYHTKELVQGRRNRGVLKGRTNNPKHRDGMRSGLIIFNEIHAYQNYDNIKVFRTGLGKRQEPREGGFTSNGEVSDGPLDDFLERGRRILLQGEDDGGFLPFICCLSEEAQVHDPENWTMANPSLPYLPTLRQETADEYADWCERPEEHGDFLTKRMNLRRGFKEIKVTDYEKVRATNQALPDLRGWSCTVGIDFAELSDFASVCAHFRKGSRRYDICKTFVCLQSKTLHRVRAPIRDWADLPLPGIEGETLVTLVDDVSIAPRLIAQYVQQIGRIFNIRQIAMDNFRWGALGEELRKIGFDAQDRQRVLLVRPSGIMQTEPVIQECFDRGYFAWGDNPCLRWAVNNTKRIRRGKTDGTDTGNFYYGKIEAKSRKTDPFMALVAAMVAERALGSGETAAPPPIGAISL